MVRLNIIILLHIFLYLITECQYDILYIPYFGYLSLFFCDNLVIKVYTHTIFITLLCLNKIILEKGTFLGKILLGQSVQDIIHQTIQIEKTKEAMRMECTVVQGKYLEKK